MAIVRVKEEYSYNPELLLDSFAKGCLMNIDISISRLVLGFFCLGLSNLGSLLNSDYISKYCLLDFINHSKSSSWSSSILVGLLSCIGILGHFAPLINLAYSDQ